MIESLQEPVAFFLLVMTIILVTPLLSERIHLPGIVGIILGGILIGPYGFGLLEIGDRMEFLATIGLVYLMFSAGMEVDIHQFLRVRNRALVFGILTYAFPQVIGFGLGRLLGLGWLGSILLGSAFASHTLIAFPIITQLGVTRNEAVAVTAGATVLTDIGAFIILTIVLGAKSGQLVFGDFLELFLLLALFVSLLILGLPRLGKAFFQRFHSRAAEFQFVLVILFVSALGAELVGVHHVVGAFLAGLAINATLPRHSPVKSHVLFIGESFFIPAFLLYSGMITNPLTFLQSPRTVIIAVAVTLVAYGSKWIAAWLTSKLFKYSRAEFMTVFGLSHAQAAVTIPTLLIGLSAGLFDASLFNAAILMILLTSITSPLLVQRFATGLRQLQEPEIPSPLFKNILVAVSNPKSESLLLELANLLALSNGGKIMVLNVVRSKDRHDPCLQAQRELLNAVPEILNSPEVEIELIPRLSTSIAQGILQTSIERDASLIVMGWRGKRALQQSILGSILDEVVWSADIPVMVSKLEHPLNGMRRVLLLLPSGSIAPNVLKRLIRSVLTLARALNVTLDILAGKQYIELLREALSELKIDHPHTIIEMIGALRIHDLERDASSDLLVIPGYGSRQRYLSSIGNLPERLAASFSGNLLVLHYDR